MHCLIECLKCASWLGGSLLTSWAVLVEFHLLILTVIHIDLSRNWTQIAYVITSASWCDHITHVQHHLHCFLPGNESTTKLHAWCLGLLSGLALAYLADDINLLIADMTCVVPCAVHMTTLTTGVSLLPVRGCGTIYRLSCDRTLATEYRQFRRQLKTFLFVINWAWRIVTVCLVAL